MSVLALSSPFRYLEGLRFFFDRVDMDDQVTDQGTPFGYGGYAGLDRSDGRLQRLAMHVRRDGLLMAAIVLAASFVSFLVLQQSPK